MSLKDQITSFVIGKFSALSTVIEEHVSLEFNGFRTSKEFMYVDLRVKITKGEDDHWYVHPSLRMNRSHLLNVKEWRLVDGSYDPRKEGTK